MVSSSSSKEFASAPASPPVAVRFVSAGLAACVADMGTFPLDTAKVRLQIQGESFTKSVIRGAGVGAGVGGAAVGSVLPLTGDVPRNTFKYRGMIRTVHVIVREEGFRALYNGLVAGLQRQLCFASIRIGLYDSVKQTYIRAFNAKDANGSNVGLRILAGITTGAAAVSVAQPTDVVKVRMQAQSSSSVQRRYTGCVDAYRTIATQEGIRGLWRGVLPNIARNAIVNAAELVSYDLIKEAILRRRLLADRMPCHVASAFGAGFCTTVVASPVDVVKTRYMNSPPGIYRGATHCAVRMYNEGGFIAFYKGFMPSFVRLSTWNIAMFVTYEQLKRHIYRLTCGRD